MTDNAPSNPPDPSTLQKPDGTIGPINSPEAEHDELQRLHELGKSMPIEYLAVGRDSIPYALRVQAIEAGSLPDVLIDTIEGAGPGYIPPGTAERTRFDRLVQDTRARIEAEQAKPQKRFRAPRPRGRRKPDMSGD